MSKSEAAPPPFGGEEAATSLDAARVVVLPVPFEGTVSYGRGASGGPEAILRASAQLELFDEQLGLEPYRVGLWTDPALPVSDEGPAEKVAELVSDRCTKLMNAGKWVMMLGGEHSITAGSVRAAVARHPDLHVVQLDAHADLRDSYEGDSWSHACAMARCLELAPVRAIGVRSYSVEEAERIRRGLPGYGILHAWEMQDAGWITRALQGLDGKPIYLTVDLDYFDPSIVPATGTPEPGGGKWWSTIRLLDDIFRRCRVVACDVVELAPIPGQPHADFTAARLVHKLIGMFAGHRESSPGT